MALSRIAGFVGVALAAAALAWQAFEPGRISAAPGLTVLADGVAIPATVQGGAFERKLLGLGMPGYHLLVHEDGRSAGAALFVTPVSDLAVLEALEQLGSRPGDALALDTWDERKNPASAAPDKVIAGPVVAISALLPGRSEPIGLEQILLDPGGKGFEMRFGGHRANIASWRSGCVACLYSCPGSKVGNARYTVRDWVRGTTRFTVKPGVLPPDGSSVTLFLRLVR
jgi:hypothetical protein